MVKFPNILVNLFNKNGSSKLETDASPMPPRSKVNSRGTRTNQTTPVNGNSPPGNPEEGPVEPNGAENLALVPTSAMPMEVVPNGSQTMASTVVNNFQHNTLTAPQTSISNAAGMQVYQIKNSNNLHIGNSFTFNRTANDECASTSGLSLQTTSNVKWANLKLSNTISQMMQSKEEADTEIIDTVSRHLGYEWKSFARKLEYSEGQIDAFEADNPTLSEQIYSFVLDWTRNDDEPTIGRLVTLLWNNRHKETVYYIKQVWKARRQNNTSGRSR